MTRALALLAVLVPLAGCGAATLPMLTSVGGAAAGVARLDTAILDGVEYLEGREAHPVGVCPVPK